MYEKMTLFIRRNLKYNLLVNIILLIVLQLVVLYFSFNTFFEDFYVKKLGDKAIGVAIAISKNEKIVNAVKNRKFEINDYIEDLRKKINCQYIVVADVYGIRYSHPNPLNVGKKFVGEDYKKAVTTGEIYTSKAVGTLGPSIRAFAPLISDGRIIGFVSVGYLISHIMEDLRNYKNILVVYLFFMGLLGLIFSNYITKKVKKLTFGLEPLAIANLYKENKALLNSIKEGIVSINESFKIKYHNDSAKMILNKNGLNFDEFLKVILERFPLSKVNYGVLESEVLEVNDKFFVVSTNPIVLDDKINGYIIIFYEKDDVERLKDEIRSMKRCSDVLRAQSHEYANKLHMLSGLLQLGAFEEAKKFLLKESEDFHNTIDYIENKITDSYIKGIFIGKFSVAKELGCRFLFNKDSKGWSYKFKDISNISIVIANIIQNGIESSMNNETPEVLISLDEDDENLYFDVEDNGKGVECVDKIFEKNFSTKGEGRGYGLFNVKIALEKLEGKIDVGKSEIIGGAKFSVTIPKVMV